MKTKALLLGLAFLTIPSLASAAEHTAGTNVLSNGTVYMVTTDGTRRPYTSSGAFLSYGFNTWTGVVPANSDDLKLPTSDFIPPRDGGITCSDRGSDIGTCYLITNGQKAGFTSADVFRKLGFNFNRVLYGDVSFLPSTGNITEATETHLPGTLINDNGTVKLIGVNGAVGVPSEDTLKSWGYSLADVVPATIADRLIEQKEVLTRHTAGELSPNLPTIRPIPCTVTAATNVCEYPVMPSPTPTPCPANALCEPLPPPISIPCAITASNTICVQPPVPVPTPTPNPSSLIITGLTPSFGTVGTVVTVSGAGFTASGNYVLFGLGVLASVPSADGKTLQFTVPTGQAPYCAPGTVCPQSFQQVTPGSYNIRIANANGMSDAQAFTVTFTVAN